MKKEFYIGQPLIIKKTREKVTFSYDDAGDTELPCTVVKNDGSFSREYYDYGHLEPSTEFKFSEIIAGLEQGYFEAGTRFVRQAYNRTNKRTVEVCIGSRGLHLVDLEIKLGSYMYLSSSDINKIWQIVEPRKEMTLEEIEAELGYKIKLKDNGGN